MAFMLAANPIEDAQTRAAREFEYGWMFIQRALDKLKRLLQHQPGETEFTIDQFMTIYTQVYNLCTRYGTYNDDHQDLLHLRCTEDYREHLRDVVLPALQALQEEVFLKELDSQWKNHALMARVLGKFFEYVDRQNQHLARQLLLKKATLICFKEEVYEARDKMGEPLKHKATRAIAAQIDRERRGERISHSLLRSNVDVFVSVGLGEMREYEDFEQVVLQETTEYYGQQAPTHSQTDTCPEYLQRAEEWLFKEDQRACNYLHGITRPRLMTVAEKAVLALAETDETRCLNLLRDDKDSDLARMFRLYNRASVPAGLPTMSKAFYQHIGNEGQKLLDQAAAVAAASKTEAGANVPGAKDAMKAADPNAFICNVLDLHRKCIEQIKNCFGNHALFHTNMREAFMVFCNKSVEGSLVAELMVNYSDTLLRKGGSSERLSEELVDQRLEQIVQVLDLIHDKDMFGEFYRKRLARRLLNDDSANEEHERIMLSRLKQQCGAYFTSKLEGILSDHQLSRENDKVFAEWLERKGASLPMSSFAVKVQTSSFWPSYKELNLKLPQDMVAATTVFQEFYKGHATAGRKLSWVHSLGSAMVQGNFTKPITMSVSTLQAAVLLLFNDTEELSYSEVQDGLSLPTDELVRVLHSLSCSKYKILLKEPSNKTIAKADKFAFNAKFTDKMRRIKVPMPPLDDRKKVMETVHEDRRYEIDAAIVRVMKARMVMNHQQLVMETVQQLSNKFKPEIKDIKKRIEDLITREFLERDHDVPGQFNYLA